MKPKKPRDPNNPYNFPRKTLAKLYTQLIQDYDRTVKEMRELKYAYSFSQKTIKEQAEIISNFRKGN